ncbi:MAG: GSCFA domain-containing protein [Bacteroidales bacterium]
MIFRTSFEIDPAQVRISYNDPVMFIGSCFASSVGSRFEAGHMPVMINPSGTVYNPVSVAKTLDSITGGKEYRMDDLYNFNGTWLSFDHYTEFSSVSLQEVLSGINQKMSDAHIFISSARFLFITLGTARVYRWKQSGKIVSNCHKIPASGFTSELLSVSDIVSLWNEKLNMLKTFNPDLKVVFTISPVRHMKDGAYGNQVSKSVLFVAVEELLRHPSGPGYFPAYELLMDDLRDYRFYEEDMLHPSSQAIDYIWDRFTECYLEKSTLALWKEFDDLSKGYHHRLRSISSPQTRKFAGSMLNLITKLDKQVPSAELSADKEYFQRLTGSRDA